MLSDYGHRQTERELKALERRIAAIYKEAETELQDKIDEYFEKLKKRDEHQRALLDAGKITPEQYKQWRLNQIGRGERFEDLRDKMAQRYTDANEVAVAYTNDATPGVYSLNRNYAAYTIERVSGDVGFTLWDEQTVKRLIVEQPELMPYYPPEKALKRGIDLAYGKQQITKQVTSGILQGESIGKLANRLQKNIPAMNRASAIRTARTAVTGAQNAGRMDSYHAAEQMGIRMKKEWLATLDNRTRHAHQLLDGQRAGVDEPFKVEGQEIRYPGDPTAAPYLVYNCRCTLIAAVEGTSSAGTGRMTYREWAASKKGENMVETSLKSATIEKKDTGSGGGTVQTIGRIDVEKYRVVSDRITTDEVVITDERIRHIKSHHPNDYERFCSYIPEIIKNPDYIVEDSRPNTAMVLKEVVENGELFRLTLRLVTPEDDPKYKNSIITFWKTKKKEWERILRNKKILYKKG